MKAINSTLLQKLFYKPMPQKSKNIRDAYIFVKDRIFPGELNFVNFLQATTIDKQMEYALKIIKRLSFESNFPPPFSTMNDVVAIETAEKNSNYRGQHVARDHFLHVIYLYMLGIYMFFYDKIFFEKIKENYKYKRVSTKDFENKEHDCLKDFISAWKYFCLYHDVGYSIEKLSNSGINLNLENISEFSRSFDSLNIHRELVTSSTMKILSRMVVLADIIKNSNVYLNENNVLYKQLSNEDKDTDKVANKTEDNDDDKEANDEIIKSINANKWLMLDKIYSSGSLKIALSVFKITDFMVMAFQKTNGKPSFAVLPTENGKHSIILFEGCKKKSIIFDIIKEPEIVFYDDFKSSAYNFQFYLNENADYGFLSNKLEHYSDLKGVLELLPQRLSDDLKSKFIRISNDQDLYDYQYEIYNFFDNNIKELDKEFTLFKALNEENVTEQDIQKMLHGLAFSQETKTKIQNDFFVSLTTQVSSMIKTDKTYEGNNITKYVGFYTDLVKDELMNITTGTGQATFNLFVSTFKAEKSEEVNAELTFRIKMLMLYCKILKQCIGLFPVSYEGMKLNFNYESKILEHDVTGFSEIYSDKIKNVFMKYFETDINLNTVINSYNVPHGNEYDHGMVTSYLYAYISNSFNKIIAKANDEQKKLLSLIFNYSLENSKIKGRIVDNYRHIQEDVFLSLFIHNISPKHFKEESNLKKYRTGIDEPFVYLALLCDSLQQWNRPHAIHPSVLDKAPNLDASNEYDIQIDDDFIAVYETNSENMQKKLKSTIDAFEEYLENPRAFVRNRFSKIIR